MLVQKETLKGIIPKFSTGGDFYEIKEVEVIIASLLAILSTLKGDRFWQPDFGCNLLRYIFEPSTSLEEIKRDILSAITFWENRVVYEYVDVKEVKTTTARYPTAITVEITICFRYKNRKYVTKFTMPEMINLTDYTINSVLVGEEVITDE